MAFFGTELIYRIPAQSLENPQTIGQHIRKRRKELKLLQSDLAKVIGVCEDTVTGWENGRSLPQIHHYPKLIDFLGYNPFPADESTLGGRIRKYRADHGISQKKLARMLQVDETSVRSWEKNKNLPTHEATLELLERVINLKEPSEEGSFILNKAIQHLSMQ